MDQHTSADLSALKQQIAMLQAELERRDELDAIRREVASGAADREVAALARAYDYKAALAEFKEEVHLQLSYFKWIAWTAGVLFALVGFLGFKGWSDITKAADTLLSKQLNEMSERYSNLSRGFSLKDSGRSAEAIAYLKPLYDSNHYDEPVLRAYIEAMGDALLCDEIAASYKELSSTRSKFEAIKDPAVFNALGFAIRECYSNIQNALSLAKDLLETSLRRYGSSDANRRYPLYNLATIALIENDQARARRLLESAATILEDYPRDIDGTKNESWFKTLSKTRPSANQELDEIWASAMKAQAEAFARSTPK